MIQTIEAVVDKEGRVQLLEPIQLDAARRAFVTILEEDPTIVAGAAALLSEAALAEDWSRPGEEDAWSHIQSER